MIINTDQPIIIINETKMNFKQSFTQNKNILYKNEK